jgi:hypothetical protein
MHLPKCFTPVSFSYRKYRTTSKTGVFRKNWLKTTWILSNYLLLNFELEYVGKDPISAYRIGELVLRRSYFSKNSEDVRFYNISTWIRRILNRIRLKEIWYDCFKTELPPATSSLQHGFHTKVIFLRIWQNLISKKIVIDILYTLQEYLLTLVTCLELVSSYQSSLLITARRDPEYIFKK